MKKRKSLVSVLLSFAIVMLAWSTNVFAAAQTVNVNAEDAVTPRYVAITVTYNNLTKGSLGRLTCLGETVVQQGNIAGVKIELQQRSNSGSWATIKTWEDSASRSVYLANDWYVGSGTYQLKLTHTSRSSSGQLLETVYKYSNTVVVN